MKLDRPVVASAAAGFPLGAIFTIGLLGLVSSPGSRLDVRELRTKTDDQRLAAVLAALRVNGATYAFNTVQIPPSDRTAQPLALSEATLRHTHATSAAPSV